MVHKPSFGKESVTYVKNTKDVLGILHAPRMHANKRTRFVVKSAQKRDGT
jgi:hypothetical protein